MSTTTGLAHPDPAAYPPLSPAAEARRQKVLALLARDRTRYAVLVENPNTDPVILALATPDGTCEILIPKGRYGTVRVLDLVDGWNREDPLTALETDDAGLLWWRVSILEPGGRTVQVDTPSGWTLPEWQAYADRYHGPGCAVTAIAQLPRPGAPANLDEVLAAACEGVAGITAAQFRALLSPEDADDIEAGDIGVEALRGFAVSFAAGIASGRTAAPGGAP